MNLLYRRGMQRRENRMYSYEMSIVFQTLPENNALRKIKKIVQENGGEFLEYRETEDGHKKTYSRGFYKEKGGQDSNSASIL